MKRKKAIKPWSWKHLNNEETRAITHKKKKTAEHDDEAESIKSAREDIAQGRIKYTIKHLFIYETYDR